jgi:hypothetical protein
MIDGDTKLIAHIGYATRTFRAPTIYIRGSDGAGLTLLSSRSA